MTMRRLYRGPGLAAAVVAMGFGLISCSASPVNSASPTTTVALPLGATLSVTTTTSTLPPTTTTLAPTTTTAAPTTTTTTTTVPKPAPTTTVPATTPPAQVVAAPATIGEGNSGPVVLSLEQQLSALGYWLGTPSSTFGYTTQQAVFALQKAANLPRTGVVDAATLAALQAGTKPAAMSTSGHVLEVNLATDLLMVVNNGVVDTILNTSTGGGYVYYSQGQRGVAITPQGHFTTYSEVDGYDVAPLGVLYRPKFFVGGYAIHGDSYVPPFPVSHGCVRVSDEAIDWIWSSGVDPIGTSVWVY